MNKNELPTDDYKYGFKNEDVSIANTGKGLNEDVIREISKNDEIYYYKNRKIDK